MIGIYKITNVITNEIYVGQSKKINLRWTAHLKNCLKKNDTNLKIINNMQKYGIENFSFQIIELCDENLLNDREQYWISYYNSFKNGLNMTPGGKNPAPTTGRHWKCSEEACKNIRNGLFKNIDKRRSNQSIAQQKRWESEDAREEQSKKSKAAWTDERRKQASENRKGKSASNKGKHRVYDEEGKWHYE